MARILIVEDDPRLNYTYDIILKKEGHDVQHAVEGNEALIIANKFNPELILLDIRLPDMDGITFLKTYDILHTHTGVKVIVFSNLEQPEHLDEAYRLGASRYILKSSTSPKQLASLITQTLAKR